MATTYDDKQIKDLYAKNLAAQTEQIEADYLEADKKINEEKLKAQKLTDENLNRTAVEAQKADMNREELHNAYGLSSGARAQARLASENQTRSDMATLRQQLQDTEAAAERERTLLSDQYASAIRQAQQQNDLALAQALYDAAQKEEDRINTQKLNDTNWERQQELNKIEAENKAYQTKLEAALKLAEENDTWEEYAKLAGLTYRELSALTNGAGIQPITNVDRFKRGIVDETTFNKYERGLDFNGKNYRDYKSYVKAKIDAWSDGADGYEPTAEEIEQVLTYYGFG